MKRLHEETKIRLNTTLGELIATLTEEAIPYVRSDREAYALTAVALAHILPRGETPPKALWIQQ